MEVNVPRIKKGAVARKIHFAEKRDAWLRHHRYLAMDSMRQMLKRPLSAALTWMVIAIALSLPTLMVMALLNLKQITGPLNEGAQLSLYLDQSVSTDRAEKLARELKQRPEIKSTRYISPNDGLREFKEFSGLGNIIDSLENNPLPALIVIQPMEETAATVEGLKIMLEALPEADTVQLDLIWVQRLNQISRIAERVVGVLGLILSMAVVLVVGNTIRLAIESRRDEILVIKLVGATDAFVRRPFLYMGFWYGLAGGIFAVIIVTTCYWYLHEPVTRLINTLSAGFIFESIHWWGTLLVIATSISISMFGTIMAVSRHIRAIEPT